MNSYTWTFVPIWASTQDGLSDVCTRILWILKSIDNNGNIGQINGSYFLAPPNPESFIPQTSVTPSDMLQWITDMMGDNWITAMKASADATIVITPVSPSPQQSVGTSVTLAG